MYLSRHAYTLYLLHVQIFGLTAHAMMSAGAYALTPIIGPILGFVAAVALTRFVETPIMNARPKQFIANQPEPFRSGCLRAQLEANPIDLGHAL